MQMHGRTANERGSDVALKLPVELVPRTAWWTNVRSHVTMSEWEKCKRYAKAKTGGVCIVCGDVGTNQGRRYAVEAHEIWAYDDTRKIQTLVDIVPLCPRCHQCKHLGRSRATMDINQWTRLIQHFMDVNQMPEGLVEGYLMNVFDVWERRSEHKWELDVSFLEGIGVHVRAS